MPPLERIAAVLAKGLAIGSDDLLEVRVALSQLPLESAENINESTFEALALIISDPAYGGELELANLDAAK